MREGQSKLAPVRLSWGCVSSVDCQGRTIWIADAHRDDGRRFVVRADEKLTAFVELKRRLDPAERPEDCGTKAVFYAYSKRQCRSLAPTPV
jgi:hypothetical protein